MTRRKIMKTKKMKTYTYNGFGFPIELHHVEMVEVDGEFHPKIDIRELAENTMQTLAVQESRLTGNQIKFIRTYFKMSLREFSKKVVHETHAAVKKWEDCGDKLTAMDVNIEKAIRLYITDKVVIPRYSSNLFYKQYQRIEQLFDVALAT